MTDVAPPEPLPARWRASGNLGNTNKRPRPDVAPVTDRFYNGSRALGPATVPRLDSSTKTARTNFSDPILLTKSVEIPKG